MQNSKTTTLPKIVGTSILQSKIYYSKKEYQIYDDIYHPKNISSETVFQFISSLEPNASSYTRHEKVPKDYDNEWFIRLVDHFIWGKGSNSSTNGIIVDPYGYDQSDIIAESSFGEDKICLSLGAIPIMDAFNKYPEMFDLYIDNIKDRKYYSPLLNGIRSIIRDKNYNEWIKHYIYVEDMVDILT